jgi:hypothetical protein
MGFHHEAGPYDHEEREPVDETQLQAFETRIAALDGLFVPQPMTIEQMFGVAPEGDFDWDDAEAGDWHASQDNDKGRSWWVMTAYSTNMSRKDGKREVTLGSVDQDGNWSVDNEWTEGDNQAQWDTVADDMARQSHDYFKGWAQYWVEAARTGTDPLNQCLRPVSPDEWYEFCVKAIEDNIKYLEMGVK